MFALLPENLMPETWAYGIPAQSPKKNITAVSLLTSNLAARQQPKFRVGDIVVAVNAQAHARRH